VVNKKPVYFVNVVFLKEQYTLGKEEKLHFMCDFFRKQSKVLEK
jgi:hypothetical protein